MTYDLPTRDPLAAFLDRKYRQVWARHRETGEWVFLDWGDATPEMRSYAKANLKCPFPGCVETINVRGRSKRDHFYHLTGEGHGEGEGEWHIQSKALLVEWANKQPGVVAAEEETVRIAAAHRDRRADVMATWPETGRRLALEVEYKDYKPEHWAIKQADYDSAGVGCTWVFGHLLPHLRQPRPPLGWPESQVWDRIKWGELVEAVARAGHPIVFINPIERTVATAVQDQVTYDEVTSTHFWWKEPQRVGIRLAHPTVHELPRLSLDNLDDCVLDSTRGLITPTMLRVESERARISRLAEIARLKAENQERLRAGRAAARREREQAASARRLPREQARDYADRKRAEQQEGWLQSDLRDRIINRLGHVPDFLDEELDGDKGVYAHPAHWHCQLFTDLVLGRAGRPMLHRTVTPKQIYDMVTAAGFKMSPFATGRRAAIHGFLEHLRAHGWIDFGRANLGIGPITIIANLDQPPVQRAAPEPAAPPMPPATPRPSRANQPTGGTSRWERSSVREALIRDYGLVPDYLASTNLGETEAGFTGLPVEWHALLFMKFVHKRPSRYAFTLNNAMDTVTSHRAVPDNEEARGAVHAFLCRLAEHGFLDAPGDMGAPDSKHTYWVTH